MAIQVYSCTSQKYTNYVITIHMQKSSPNLVFLYSKLWVVFPASLGCPLSIGFSHPFTFRPQLY